MGPTGQTADQIIAREKELDPEKQQIPTAQHRDSGHQPSPVPAAGGLCSRHDPLPAEGRLRPRPKASSCAARTPGAPSRCRDQHQPDAGCAAGCCQVGSLDWSLVHRPLGLPDVGAHVRLDHTPVRAGVLRLSRVLPILRRPVAGQLQVGRRLLLRGCRPHLLHNRRPLLWHRPLPMQGHEQRTPSCR